MPPPGESEILGTSTITLAFFIFSITSRTTTSAAAAIVPMPLCVNNEGNRFSTGTTLEDSFNSCFPVYAVKHGRPPLLLDHSKLFPYQNDYYTRDGVVQSGILLLFAKIHWGEPMVFEIGLLPWSATSLNLTTTGAELTSNDSIEMFPEKFCSGNNKRKLVLFPLCPRWIFRSFAQGQKKEADICPRALWTLPNGEKLEKVYRQDTIPLYSLVIYVPNDFQSTKTINSERNAFLEKSGGSPEQCTSLACFGIKHLTLLKTIERSHMDGPKDAAHRHGDQGFTHASHDIARSAPVDEEPGAVDLSYRHLTVSSKLPIVLASVYLLLHVLNYLQKSSCLFVSANIFCCWHFARIFSLHPVQETSRSQQHWIKRPKFPRYFFGWMLLTVPIWLICRSSMACTDIRNSLSNYNCLNYDTGSSTFSMLCSFVWTVGNGNCIVLRKNEIFAGNGYSIDLTGNNNWEGLFRIATDGTNGPSSLDDAPVIHDVHMLGGQTSTQGGFFIRAEQRHFIVRNCSSSGRIRGQACNPCVSGGGICGHGCAGDILITHCWSSGEIRGNGAGGIAGREFGLNGDADNQVMISHCYSTGNIVGANCGGICGFSAGKSNKGMVTIKRCYSVGQISGERSGGITGGQTAHGNGHVSITNCYSRGRITGSFYSGGICGISTGINSGTVILTNVYASGEIARTDAGGLIGHISEGAKISITMSVCNGGKMIGSSGAVTLKKNSGDLKDITGSVYCYSNGGGAEECWDTKRIWQAVDNNFPLLMVPPLFPSPSQSPSPTPSISPTPKKTQTSTPTSSITASNTPTVTASATRSPTPTVTSTSTQTGSSTPSSSVTISATPTHTPSYTASSTASGTSTASQTSTVTPSHTPTRTRSRSETASQSVTGTPTYTAQKTASATASPSTFFPANESQLIVSACGVMQAFDCVSIHYQATVNVVWNATSTVNAKVDNTSTVIAQSVDGTAPSLQLLCGLDVDGTTANPVDCLDQLSTERNGIPFHAEYELVSNQTCRGRIRTNRCRVFAFVVKIYIAGNVSAGNERHLAEDGLINNYAMTTSVIYTKETLLSMRQYVNIAKQMTTVAPIEVSIHPSMHSMTMERDRDIPASYNITIQVAGQSDLSVSWILPPRLLQFMEAPKTEPIASGVLPPRLAIRNQILSIQTHLLPRGISADTIEIRLSKAGELLAKKLFYCNITVVEGVIRLRQSSVEITRSFTEGPTSRAILMVNEGGQKVYWTSRMFSMHGTDSEKAEIPWLSFPRNGSFSYNQERPLHVEVSPQLAGLGVSEAWILIETNSWSGDSQNLKDEFGDLSVPLVETLDVSFWIHLRFIVRSIFVCQQFAPVTKMGPNEIRILPLRVINTESQPITVGLRDFSIRKARNGSVATMTEGTMILEHSIGVEKFVANRVLWLTPWWTIAPLRLALQPGTSGGFRMVIKYSDGNLLPQALELTFVLEVFFGTVVDTPAGIIGADFVIEFEPGIADPKTSYMIGNGTQGHIGDHLDFSVKLLDVFGHGPATALFGSKTSVSGQRQHLPLLTITSRTLSSSYTNSVLRLDVFNGRGIVTELLFGLHLQSDGQVEIDVKLGNVSVTNFPLTIVSDTIRCRLEFEVPDPSGTLCLCKSGNYRSESGLCIPCLPGTIMPSASNEGTCPLCPRGSFAEAGESACHVCDGNGIHCHDGIASMKNGYWCELCQRLQFPRAIILERIREGKGEFFHECSPSESCVVNATAFAMTCASGYVKGSPICDTCENGFVKTQSGECLECKNSVQDLALTIVGASFIVLVIAVIAVFSSRDVITSHIPESQPDKTYQCSNRKYVGKHTRSSKFASRLFSHDGVVRLTIKNPLHGHVPVHTPNEQNLPRKSQDHTLRRKLVAVRHIALLLLDYFQIMFILNAMEISPFASSNKWINTVSIMATFTPTQAGAVQCTMDSSPFLTSLLTIMSPIMALVCVIIAQALATFHQSKCKSPFP